MQRFWAGQRALRDILDAAHGLALDRIEARSTAEGASEFKLNVAAWIAATLAHQRRHLAQARRVTETAGFALAHQQSGNLG